MNLIVEHLEAWLILSLVGLLTVFSDKIVGRVRFALNRADLRSKYYEALALDLSTFVFYSDLFHVRYIRGESHFKDVDAIRGEVNGSFVTLKTKEYVYRSWVRRYWSDNRVKRFESVMLSATNVYDAIIEFNEKGKEAKKTETLGRCLEDLKLNVNRWLSDLDA
jgi:hypothetical protein